MSENPEIQNIKDMQAETLRLITLQDQVLEQLAASKRRYDQAGTKNAGGGNPNKPRIEQQFLSPEDI